MGMGMDIQFTLPAGLEGKYWTFLTNEDYTQICWLGSFGTAKSDALITSIIKTAFDYPGCRMVLARDELTNLKRTTLADLISKAMDNGAKLIEDHNRTESVLTFPPVVGHDGVAKQSVLFCFGLMTGDYKQKLKSLQPFRIFIDEADKIYEEMLDMCVLRLRQKVYHRETGKLGKNQVKLAANDEGNNWLWRRFVGKPHPGMDMTPEWTKEHIGLKEDYYTPESVDQDLFVGDLVEYSSKRHLIKAINVDRSTLELSGLDEPVKFDRVRVVLQKFCIYAFSHENKSLNQQNLRNARDVSPAMRDQYIKGRVDIKTGLLFPEFDPNVHVIPEADVPEEWRVVVGIDHGFDHPTAGVYLTVDPGGTLFVFEEYELAGASASENAYNILDKLNGHDKTKFVGDSQMWAVDPRRPSESVSKDYLDAGVRPLRPANKARMMSINRLKEYLKLRHTLNDPRPKARLYVTANCKGVIRTLSSIKWEQFEGKSDDDLLDALRYAVMDVYNPSADRPDKVGGRPFTIGR